LDKQGSFPPRKYTPAVSCGMLTLLVVQQWCDRRDVGRSFGWKRLSCHEVLFISQRTGMVGRKNACRSEPIVHFAEIRSARHDVVVRIKWIDAQSVSDAQFNPGAWHDLHQPESALRRDGSPVSCALKLHDSANPLRGNRKSAGCLGDKGRKRFNARRAGRARPRYWRFTTCPCVRQQRCHHERAGKKESETKDPMARRHVRDPP